MPRIRGILSIIIFILSITVPGPHVASQRAQPDCFFTSALQLPEQSQKDEVWMTIFIHGSITPMIRPPGPVLAIKLLVDKLEGTLYEQATRIFRNNHFFTKNQPMQGIGLQKIKKTKYRALPATIIANIFDKLDEWLHGRPAENNLQYTYGWSGIVGQKIRYNETKQFYEKLSQEIRQLNSIGITPKIRIVGFCHGAHLGINLARVYQKEQPKFTFNVDELILLSMPINKKLNKLLHSPMFKKIYNLYSTNDWIQRLDLLAPGSIFTRRLFVPRRGEKIPQKVKQIRVKIMQNKKTKKSFPQGQDPRQQFYRPEIISGSSKLLQDMSPLHLEQWFFGWTDRDYRRTFPLYPLPVLSLVPAIISAVEQCETDVHCCCTADIRPDQKVIIIKGKNTYTVTSMLPGQRDFSELLSLIPQPQPVQITTQEYRRQVRIGVKKAKQNMRHKKQNMPHQVL